ncbi:unnamed protein product [Mycena citricolor]|uniref:Calcofluor white hypersensitive protein n=1 Tax=Mycena citricolor TaxID=2018698 RepID=A0AAD2H3M2_9AGAR|nr:unnamed protein product [Mycena citricolor]
MLSSLSKHANHSNNPIWPLVNAESGGWNKTGILLAVLAIYERWLNPMPQPKSQAATPSGRHWATAAIPLGGLIFTLHSCFSDPSTLIVWSWTGYENSLPRGPLPHVHGALTLLAQGVGLLLAPSSFPTHPGWFLYGALSTAVLFTYRNWLGYIGGLNLAVFAMSGMPSILSRAGAAAREHGPGRVYFAAMLVYALLGVSSVWTVAYAFVPGGMYLRERTDLVLMAQMACISLAFRRSSPSQGSPSNTGLSRAVLALFAIASLLVTLYRTPSEFPRPFKPGPRILTAGIWTLHFGMDNEGRDSQRLVRDVVRDMELDVVGLLETDLHRIVFGNRDLTRVIIEESGYYVDIGPSTLSHTWGAVLLSKFPIVNSTHHLLPSPHGELAPAIEAVLDVFGTYVTVVVAHNGQEEDPLDRELQSTELARIMRAAPGPVIFLGYVVTKPLAARREWRSILFSARHRRLRTLAASPYEILVQDGNVFDVDRDDWDRWCEYIFYRGLYRTAYARISRGKVTDTELQIARFVVPPFGTQVVDDSDEARYLRSFKEDLPVDHWFTMDYYQENGGKAGHVYHVFGTPLYYKLPA